VCSILPRHQHKLHSGRVHTKCDAGCPPVSKTKIVAISAQTFSSMLFKDCHQLQRYYKVGDRWMNEYGVLMEWCWQGKYWSTCRKTCPCAILSSTNPIWTGMGFNQGLCGDRMATNHLSHGTASLRNVRVNSLSKPAPMMLVGICPKYDRCLQCSEVHNHQQQEIAHPK
jgi:hypothetical protein